MPKLSLVVIFFICLNIFFWFIFQPQNFEDADNNNSQNIYKDDNYTKELSTLEQKIDQLSNNVERLSKDVDILRKKNFSSSTKVPEQDQTKILIPPHDQLLSNNNSNLVLPKSYSPDNKNMTLEEAKKAAIDSLNQTDIFDEIESESP